jgi:hypothetical protein
MEILKWQVEAGLVDKGMRDPTPRIDASNPCPCGCSPKPFVLICNGTIGLTVLFDTEEELEAFKSKARVLSMDDDRCHCCEHLVTVSRPRENWIGACEFNLRPTTCGDRFELAKIYEGHDPRKMKH